MAKKMSPVLNVINGKDAPIHLFTIINGFQYQNLVKCHYRHNCTNSNSNSLNAQ